MMRLCNAHSNRFSAISNLLSWKDAPSEVNDPLSGETTWLSSQTGRATAFAFTIVEKYW